MALYAHERIIHVLGGVEVAKQFAELFVSYKSMSFAEQIATDYFGSDGEYARPLVLGAPQLRHTHLAPSRRDRDSWRRWCGGPMRGGPRTSDRALVYAENVQGDIFLIALLAQGTAHRVAEMRDAKSRELMGQFARDAGDWLTHGEECLCATALTF